MGPRSRVTRAGYSAQALGQQAVSGERLAVCLA